MNLDAPVALKDGLNGQNGDQHVENEEDEEEEDSDFDATGFTSDEDDEVREMRNKYKQFMSAARKRGDIHGVGFLGIFKKISISLMVQKDGFL